MILTSEAEARAWFAARGDLNPLALARLEKLEAMLREENLRQNLVSAASLEEVWVRHLADSAQLLDFVPRETGGPWLDLGTGGGFPGLVVAACRPEMPIMLVESRAQRAAWLRLALATLDLRSASVVSMRLERRPSHPTSVISARAFAPLAQLIVLSARFSTPQTHWLLPKGRGGRQELEAMPKSVQEMFHVEQSITDPESVILVGKGVPAPRRKADHP